MLERVREGEERAVFATEHCRRCSFSTRFTSHITHTSHVTRHTSHATPQAPSASLPAHSQLLHRQASAPAPHRDSGSRVHACDRRAGTRSSACASPGTTTRRRLGLGTTPNLLLQLVAYSGDCDCEVNSRSGRKSSVECTLGGRRQCTYITALQLCF